MHHMYLKKNILITQLSHNTVPILTNRDAIPVIQEILSSFNNFNTQMSFKSLACSRNHSNTIFLPFNQVTAVA